MARKPQSRKTAKKRGGVRRRKTTARRGGNMLSKQQIITVTGNKKGIADINGDTVNLGDLVEIKGSMLTGSKNDGKYILLEITGSNVTFMGIPKRIGENMNGVLQYRPSVHIINMNYNNQILGYTVKKATDNTIKLVNNFDNIEETITFNSKNVYEKYNDIVLYKNPNYDAILQLKGKLPDTWEQFQEKVNATTHTQPTEQPTENLPTNTIFKGLTLPHKLPTNPQPANAQPQETQTPKEEEAPKEI
jgi:hypothetical protein